MSAFHSPIARPALLSLRFSLTTLDTLEQNIESPPTRTV